MTRHLIAQLRRSLYRFRKKIKASSASSPLNEYNFDTTDELIEKRECWYFCDETLECIRNRFKYRATLREGREVPECKYRQAPTDELQFNNDGVFVFKGKTKSTDEWLLTIANNCLSWDNYIWEFEFNKQSSFKELQFDFRYRDLFHRYRYRLENDCLYFDILYGGKSYHALSAMPCVLQLDRWYRFRIEVLGNEFRCYVDNELISVDFDFRSLICSGTIAVILWEDDGITNMLGKMRHVRLQRIIKG